MSIAAAVRGGLVDALSCPRCGGALADVEGGYRCDRCGGGYPLVGTIACLVDDPMLWRTVCLRRLDDYSQAIELRIAGLRDEAEAPGLAPRTRQRLRRTADAFEQQLEVVTSLFEPLDVGS